VRVTSLGGGKRVSQPPVPEGRTSDKMNVASIRSFYKLITRAVCYKLSFDATAPLKTLPPRSFARSLADRHLDTMLRLAEQYERRASASREARNCYECPAEQEKTPPERG